MSPAANVASAAQPTILAFGHTEEDVSAVLDRLERADPSQTSSSTVDGRRTLAYTRDDGLRCHIVDFGTASPPQSYSSPVQAAMFAADIAAHDQPAPPAANGLRSALDRFAAVGTAPALATAPIILFMRGADAFAAKLAVAPLQECFPDYYLAHDEGTRDLDAPMSWGFVASKFAEACPREGSQIYAHPQPGSGGEEGDLKFVVAAVEDIMAKNDGGGG